MTYLNIVPEGHNKAVYYALPLTGLSMKTFGESFINVYLTYNGKVCVQLQHGHSVQYLNEQGFITDFDSVDKEGNLSTIMVFHVLPTFTEDLIKFTKGEYSQMSKRAKEQIILKSGLDYKAPIPNNPPKTRTHTMLLALERSETLRNWLQEELGEEIDENSELLDVPGVDEFLDIQGTELLPTE